MENQTQFFIIAKTKNPTKVYRIEAEYEEVSHEKLLRKCARCRKTKHVTQFGTSHHNGKPLKTCDACREYHRYYNALRNCKG